MTVSDIISALKSTSLEDLTREREQRQQAKAETIAFFDQEIELIDRLITVVSPAVPSEEVSFSELKFFHCPQPTQDAMYVVESQPVVAVTPEPTTPIEATIPEPINAAPAIEDAAQAEEPEIVEVLLPKPKSQITAAAKAHKLRAELKATPLPNQIAACLEYMGRTGATSLTRQLKLMPQQLDQVLDVLESNKHLFVQDKQGFWDLRSRVAEREEREGRLTEHCV